jgi:hypothetical protein
MSFAIYAEIFGRRIRTEEDVEYLKGWGGGDKHIDMKPVNLPNVVSCQPNHDMMFLTEMYFLSFFWITQYFLISILFRFWIWILGAFENVLNRARHGVIYLG